jgi:hypothetical protein
MCYCLPIERKGFTMNNSIESNRATSLPYGEACEIARQCNWDDPDWTYRVVKTTELPEGYEISILRDENGKTGYSVEVRDRGDFIAYL